MLSLLRRIFSIPAKPAVITSHLRENSNFVQPERRLIDNAQAHGALMSLLKDDGSADYLTIYKALLAHRGRPEIFIDWVTSGLEGDWFPSKVVGVSHRNDDRTSRQAAIRKLDTLHSLELEPEPANPYDKDAIRVLNSDDRQIGYLDRRLAGETSRAMRKGVHFLCFVLDVTGEDQPTRGVNIAIIRWGPKLQP